MKPQLWVISIAVIMSLVFSVTVTLVPSLVLENDSETDTVCYRTNANRINRTQPGQEQYCDANTPCESGECYKFEDEETPICFEGDPCSKCPSGMCNFGESYPMQVFCIEEQYCDANTPCESGECYKFEDEETSICFEGDPCSRCPSGKCNIAESYPMQVFCIDEDEVTTFPVTWLIIGVIAVGVVAVLVLSMKHMRIR